MRIYAPYVYNPSSSCTCEAEAGSWTTNQVFNLQDVFARISDEHEKVTPLMCTDNSILLQTLAASQGVSAQQLQIWPLVGQSLASTGSTIWAGAPALGCTAPVRFRFHQVSQLSSLIHDTSMAPCTGLPPYYFDLDWVDYLGLGFPGAPPAEPPQNAGNTDQEAPLFVIGSCPCRWMEQD
jgi:hypothetical protein